MGYTVCIIQARIGSTRLPGKVLLPLPTGRSVLGEVVHRCEQIPGINEIVVAIPVGDDPLLVEVEGHRVTFGPEDDVLARYSIAAEVTDADRVMRITADCPMLNPKVCGEVLDLYMTYPEALYASNVVERTYPKGWDCEVFSRNILDMAYAEATEAYDREHVTPWIIRTNAESLVTLRAAEDHSGDSCTLDTIDDYRTIWRRLYHLAPSERVRAHVLPPNFVRIVGGADA